MARSFSINLHIRDPISHSCSFSSLVFLVPNLSGILSGRAASPEGRRGEAKRRREGFILVYVLLKRA